MIRLSTRLALLFFFAATLRGEIKILSEIVPSETKDGQAITVPPPTTGTGTAQPQKKEDTLRFLNQDALHGKLLSIDSKSGVHWLHYGAKNAIEINPSHITTIKLQSQTTPAPKTQAAHVVELNNLDSLTGDVASLDSDKLILNTWYAGPISIGRNILRSIRPAHPSSTALYEGPVSLEEWKRAENDAAWKFKDGALMCQGSSAIGREVKLPDIASLEFDIEWKGELYLNVFLYADSLDASNEYPTAYSLAFTSDSATLSSTTPNGNGIQLGSASFDEQRLKSKWHVNICVSKSQHIICLVMDGLPVRVWNLPEPFAAKGTGVVFYPENDGFIKLGDIRVSAWDGRIDTPAAPAAASTTDIVKLSNSDHFSGSIKNISNGKISFASTHGPLQIPMQELSEIIFAGGDQPPKPSAGEVTAFLSDGGIISFQLEQWDEKTIAGSSPTLGKLKFLPGAFEKLQYNEEPPDEDDEVIPLDNEGGINQIQQEIQRVIHRFRGRQHRFRNVIVH